MNDDEHDDLWHLLGKARPAKVTPAFVQNVLRATRMSVPARTSAEPGFLEWLRSGWNWIAAAGAAVVLLFAAIGTQQASRTPSTPPLAANETEEIDQVVDSPEFAVIANFDALTAVDENDLWLDPTLR